MAFNEEESLHRAHRARLESPARANARTTPDDDPGYCSNTFLRVRTRPSAIVPLGRRPPPPLPNFVNRLDRLLALLGKIIRSNRLT